MAEYLIAKPQEIARDKERKLDVVLLDHMNWQQTAYQKEGALSSGANLHGEESYEELLQISFSGFIAKFGRDVLERC